MRSLRSIKCCPFTVVRLACLTSRTWWVSCNARHNIHDINPTMCPILFRMPILQAFMERLGLWGQGLTFESFEYFLKLVREKGIGGLFASSVFTATIRIFYGYDCRSGGDAVDGDETQWNVLVTRSQFPVGRGSFHFHVKRCQCSRTVVMQSFSLSLSRSRWS